MSEFDFYDDDSKVLSCGFIIVNNDGAILATHPSGAKYGEGSWNLPKGRKEPNETPLEAAKRELMEEANVEIPDDADIFDCGVYEYTPKKDLHLFVVNLDVDITSVYCASTFFDSKRECYRAENDAFKFTKNIKDFNKSMAHCVSKACNDALAHGFDI